MYTITDGGMYEISKKVADLLRSLLFKQYESDPYHLHLKRLSRDIEFSRGTSIH